MEAKKAKEERGEKEERGGSMTHHGVNDATNGDSSKTAEKARDANTNRGESVVDTQSSKDTNNPGHNKDKMGPDDGYGLEAAVDLHTGSIVFSEKGTLSDTYQWLLAEDGGSAKGEQVKPCPAFCYTKLCVAKCYSILLGFALVSLIITVVMIVSSVPKLQAYRYTTGFQAANCSTKKAEFHGHWETCECNQRQSSYPCVQIYVRHGGSVQGNASTPQSYLIRSTEEDLVDNLKCSYKPLCNCDKQVNKIKVIRFINIYQLEGTTFACFYNTRNASEVIRVQTLNEASELGKMLVPASIFAICILALFLIWILRMSDAWPVVAEDKSLKPEVVVAS